MIEPFEIPSNDEAVRDPRYRLHASRWNDAVTSDWSYGMERGFLERLVTYWRDDYDWGGRRSVLNRLPHCRARIDGYGVHFLHFRANRPDAIPLLLMNGWPSNFVEYQRLVALLLEGSPCFEVVIPTLPGFGFSDRPTRPYQVEPAALYAELMTVLGYQRFVVAGTDIGAGVATRVAPLHSDLVLAVHVSSVATKQAAAGAPPRPPTRRLYDNPEFTAADPGVRARGLSRRSGELDHREVPRLVGLRRQSAFGVSAGDAGRQSDGLLDHEYHRLDCPLLLR